MSFVLFVSVDDMVMTTNSILLYLKSDLEDSFMEYSRTSTWGYVSTWHVIYNYGN